MNKNNHTTSTKCQYQAAASNPTWWEVEKWLTETRNRLTNKKRVPMITWSPWNPVATKNVEPNTLSEIANETSIYSLAWIKVNQTPSNTVNKIPNRPLWLHNIAWWAQVTVTPDESRITVFNKGTPQGSRVSIPRGGHLFPSLMSGDSLIWKNAQKNAKKKHTSEMINKTIPNFKPRTTTTVWYPW